MRGHRVVTGWVRICQEPFARNAPVLIGAWLMLSCSSSPSSALPATPANDTAQDAAQRYEAAIQDAEHAETLELRHDLVAIVPTNLDLRWRGAKVLVATAMSEADFQSYYAGKTENLTPAAHGIVWVSAVPELQRFCQQIARIEDTPHGVASRVVEWLGLPPQTQLARVVELEVEPKDLIRPCADTDVTDSACDLSPPAVPTDADAEYATWFEDKMRRSYQPNGFPWTRLGYTYDWAPKGAPANSKQPVGASEFMVRPKTQYTIASTPFLQDYCQSPGS